LLANTFDACVQLSEAMLLQFDVRKVRSNTLIERQVLDEIWGQKLEEIMS
jgi:hypothetical protein